MSLLEECALECPYCGESITVLIDVSEVGNTYVEDCEVCCQPMLVSVYGDGDAVYASLRREDE